MATDVFRPTEWDDYVGQEKLKAKLEVFCEAARLAKEPLGHVLLTGPPGIGKTTLANLIADKTNQQIKSYVAPIQSAVLQSTVIRHRGIIFLDELHRTPVKQQEEFLPLLEDGFFQLPQGGRILAPWLTMIGATTEPEKLIPPLYDRFVLKPLFEPYSVEEMEQMVLGMAGRVGTTIVPSVARDLATAANGNPRNARQLVNAARSLSLTQTDYTSEDVCRLAGVTADGLSDQHIEYLRVLDAMGGKAGLTPLATMLRLHPKVVNEIERVLIEKNMLTYESNGRQLTADAYGILVNNG